MKKIYILFILSLCDPFAFGQQSAMLEKYRSMALEYSHDLKAAEKNLAASIELEEIRPCRPETQNSPVMQTFSIPEIP